MSAAKCVKIVPIIAVGESDPRRLYLVFEHMSRGNVLNTVRTAQFSARECILRAQELHSANIAHRALTEQWTRSGTCSSICAVFCCETAALDRRRRPTIAQVYALLFKQWSAFPICRCRRPHCLLCSVVYRASLFRHLTKPVSKRFDRAVVGVLNRTIMLKKTCICTTNSSANTCSQIFR